MATRTLSLVEITESQAGKYITHNTALHQLDAWTSVKSRTTFAPTISPLPTQGDAYIVTSATGDWSGFTVGDLVVYYLDSAGAAAWVGVSPAIGPMVYVEDEEGYVRWDGSAWDSVGAILEVEDATIPSPNTYQLSLTDAGKYLRFGAACTVQVPDDATVNFPIGAQVVIRRSGTDAVTIAAEAVSPEVVLNGSVALTSQHDNITLTKVGSKEWDAS